MTSPQKKYVLDSYAVLCYLQDEPGADIMASLLEKAQQKEIELYMTWVNCGEVYYRVRREYGRGEAGKIVELLEQWPLKMISADKNFCLAAAAIKAENVLAYADAFAIAAVLMTKGTLVTGDPEIQKASEKEGFELLWLE
ncbi:MAG: type II toxin-antitoxin system VapC family toxin [Syntrophomonadaceae bacterium]|mgnify:CR=1 FL=1|nr:type II toxin-antitoxin system VapC family toxin [Syntrophomonadaceae bacterium]